MGRVSITMMFCAVCLVFTVKAFSTEFIVGFTGVPEQARDDVHRATAIWSQCLKSKAPIHLHVRWMERGPTGFAVPRGVRNLPHLPRQNLWYPASLANALLGHRDNQQDDMNIFLSAKTNWYFHSESPIAPQQTDFINVVLHEIAHGLGLSSTSFTPWQGEPVSSIGFPNEYIDFFDYTFEMIPLDGTPALYDAFIVSHGNQPIIEQPNPSMALTKALQADDIRFVAANVEFAVTPGNITHVPALGGPTPIMLSNSGVGESVHMLDHRLLGMLRAIGWEIREECDT